MINPVGLIWPTGSTFKADDQLWGGCGGYGGNGGMLGMGGR